MKSLTVWRGHSTWPSLPVGTARRASGSLPRGRRNRLIMQTTKNRKFPLGRFCPAGRKARGTGCSNPPLLLLHKIHAKQKEQHPTRCCSWCDREDSNLWPSGSENYDAAHDLMIYCDFLLVLHCYGTPITNNIKQCVNDKTDHRQQKSLLVVSWWSIFEIHIF